MQTPDWPWFELRDEGKQLSILCTEPNHEKIFAILTIFDAGYNVSR